jgi:UPF0716 protein FxsA
MRLLLLFTVLPALELYLLLKIGAVIGAFDTLLLIFVTGVLGATMARREGFAVLAQLSAEAEQGFPSGTRVVEGLLILAGGLLLLTPGVVTDFLGFSLILPFSRRPLAERAKAWITRHGAVSAAGFTFGTRSAGGEDPPAPAKDPFQHPRA